MDQDQEKGLPEEEKALTEETPKKASKGLKYVKSPLFWLIFGGSVLLCGVLGLALALFLPMLVGNPVINTWNAVFFETESIQELLESWEEDGWESRVECDIPSELSGLLQDFYVEVKGNSDGEASEIELALGAEQNRAGVTLYYDGQIVALKGLTADEEEYVSFPRVGLGTALEESVFHPASATRYALSEEEYRELCALLHPFEILDEDAKEAEEEFWEELVELCYEELRPTVEYGFSTNPFGISQKMTLLIDEACAKRVLDLAIKQAKEAELDTYAFRFEQYKNSVPAGLLIKIRCTVVGERVTFLGVNYQSAAALSDLSAKLFFTYGNSEVKLDLSLQLSLSLQEGETVKLSSEHTYRKIDEGNQWRVRYSDYITTELVGEEPQVSRSNHKIDLVYKEDGAWRLSYLSTGEKEWEMTLSGVLVLDMGKNEFHFTIDRVERENEHTSRAILEILISESDKEVEKVKEHTEFFAFTANQLRDFLQNLPLRELDRVFYEVTGVWFGTYTVEGKPLYPSVARDKLLEKYITYFGYHLEDRLAPVHYVRIYLYDESLDTYFLLRYDMIYEQIYYDLAYELSEKIEAQYQPAHLYDEDVGLVFG